MSIINSDFFLSFLLFSVSTLLICILFISMQNIIIKDMPQSYDIIEKQRMMMEPSNSEVTRIVSSKFGRPRIAKKHALDTNNYPTPKARRSNLR